MRKFFELHKDVKLKYKKQDVSVWCGYTEPGEELYVISWQSSVFQFMDWLKTNESNFSFQVYIQAR